MEAIFSRKNKSLNGIEELRADVGGLCFFRTERLWDTWWQTAASPRQPLSAPNGLPEPGCLPKPFQDEYCLRKDS